MNKLRSKLASKRGASLILALVAVAICLTIGASILMSASAAYDSLKSREKGEAARLAVSSAAGVMDDLFANKSSMTVTYVSGGFTGIGSCTQNHSVTTSWDGTPAGSELVKALQTMSLNAVKGTTGTKKLTLRVGTGLPVYVSLSVKARSGAGTAEDPFMLEATAELWTGSETDQENPVSMTYTGYFEENAVSEIKETCTVCSGVTTTVTTEYKLVWKAKKITNEVS